MGIICHFCIINGAMLMVSRPYVLCHLGSFFSSSSSTDIDLFAVHWQMPIDVAEFLENCIHSAKHVKRILFRLSARILVSFTGKGDFRITNDYLLSCVAS